MQCTAVFAATLLWSAGAALCSPSQVSSDSFSEQAAKLISSIKMPDDELAAVPNILHDLELTISKRWPGSKVRPFGSTTTGLALVGSDIDAYVILPDPSIQQNGSINYKAVPVLKRSPDYGNIHPRRLYVSFEHLPSHTKVDLLFNNIEGGRNSALLRYLLNIDDRALDLAIIIKYWWAKTQKLAGYRMVPNYGMHVMVVFYLQQVHILPPIMMLQKNAKPYVVKGWNSGFNKIDYKPRNNDTLYQLLGGFFEFYNDFDYDKYIISSYVGRPVERILFKKLRTVPVEFEWYIRNVGGRKEKPVDLSSSVVIQDLVVHNSNLAVMKGPREGSPFATEFKRLALHYQENNESVFLDEILSVQVT